MSTQQGVHAPHLGGCRTCFSSFPAHRATVFVLLTLDLFPSVTSLFITCASTRGASAAPNDVHRSLQIGRWCYSPYPAPGTNTPSLSHPYALLSSIPTPSSPASLRPPPLQHLPLPLSSPQHPYSPSPASTFPPLHPLPPQHPTPSLQSPAPSHPYIPSLRSTLLPLSRVQHLPTPTSPPSAAPYSLSPESSTFPPLHPLPPQHPTPSLQSPAPSHPYIPSLRSTLLPICPPLLTTLLTLANPVHWRGWFLSGPHLC